MKALMARVFTSTSEIIALVESGFPFAYSRSGMIKLLARLGFEYKKPKALPRLPTVQAQQAFVADIPSSQPIETKDEVVFLDAVHPEYQSRPAHGWIKKGDRVAICGRRPSPAAEPAWRHQSGKRPLPDRRR